MQTFVRLLSRRLRRSTLVYPMMLLVYQPTMLHRLVLLPGLLFDLLVRLDQHLHER